MDAQELANKLARIDELETWKEYCTAFDSSVLPAAYSLAIPIWIKRMLDSGKLFLHPEVEEQLRSQKYTPNDLQKRMIWASVIASDESPNSKERFYRIKEKLIKRYDKIWWDDVYKRKNYAFAAKERIKRNLSGPMVSKFISSTQLGTTCAKAERDKALRMIPKGEV